MYDLGKLIKKLREEKNISMDKMCDDFNKKYNAKIVKSTISKWENNKAEPSLSNARYLSDYFNVTLDCILGLEEYETPLTTDENNLLKNYNKLNDLGKQEANKRIEELTEINRYLAVDEMLATKDIELMTIAANDDGLTDDEKDFMQKRIEEYEKNK